jgi:hypothetical protein
VCLEEVVVGVRVIRGPEEALEVIQDSVDPGGHGVFSSSKGVEDIRYFAYPVRRGELAVTEAAVYSCEDFED